MGNRRSSCVHSWVLGVIRGGWWLVVVVFGWCWLFLGCFWVVVIKFVGGIVCECGGGHCGWWQQVMVCGQ